MYDNATHTGNAVTNPANYQLLLNGKAMTGAIVKVDYGLNEASNLAQMAIANPTLYGSYSDLSTLPTDHYEIVLTIDANGTQAGTPGLGSGSYTLVLKAPTGAVSGVSTGSSGLTNVFSVPLNQTGFTSMSGVPTGVNYTLDFSVVLAGASGANILVNQTTAGIQTTNSTADEPTTSQYNSRTIAVDHSGDFAVTWISYGQDGDPRPTLPNGSVNPNYDPNAATAAGVYVRVFDRNNNPLCNEELVNTYTIGDQTSPVVAMDADGDFVVVWASQGQDPDGSWGIYGQRFNSMGVKVGGEFRVNTNYTSDQVSPAVAMNSFGQFIVVWATKGQSFSYFNDIDGQMFGPSGERLGGEFQVNSADIPGTGAGSNASALHPSVAIDDMGSFVVTWDAITAQKNGIGQATIVMARVFDSDRNPVAVGGGSSRNSK